MRLKDPMAAPYIVGDMDYRNKDCPTESAEQMTFLNQLKKKWPALGAVAVHVKNEGMLRGGQFSAKTKDQLMGAVKGASDIIIPCTPPIVIELKRKDPTLSSVSIEQIQYLSDCQDLGAHVCIALGWEHAMEFVGAKYGYL